MDECRHPAAADTLRAGTEPDGFIPLRLLREPQGPPVLLPRPEMVLGRHSESDVCLRLPDVSRRHCRFLFAAGCWRVFDLQSTNGLFVNHERVQDATLQHQDVIRIGSYLFEVDLDTAAAVARGDEVETRVPMPPERLAS